MIFSKAQPVSEAPKLCFVGCDVSGYPQKETSLLITELFTRDSTTHAKARLASKSKKANPKIGLSACFFWSGRRDSNSLPLAPHTG